MILQTSLKLQYLLYLLSFMILQTSCTIPPIPPPREEAPLRSLSPSRSLHQLSHLNFRGRRRKGHLLSFEVLVNSAATGGEREAIRTQRDAGMMGLYRDLGMELQYQLGELGQTWVE